MAVLRANLRKIDGWGELAWKEMLGAWKLSTGTLLLTLPEFEADQHSDERLAFLVINHALLTVPQATDKATAQVAADWVLREAWATWLASPAITAWTLRPGNTVRSTNACWLTDDGQLVLRIHLILPYAGMCIDAKLFARFVREAEAFATALATPMARPTLSAHCRSVARQQALRAALPAHDLIAFLAEGAVLPRAGDGGGPASAATPLRVPNNLAITIDLGRHGRVRGWGIRRGVTAIAGAPYHGKSTVLQALQAGIEDRPPGDGREGVVSIPSALFVQAEDGRPIKDQDLSGFFSSLPGADARHFTTTRASGATSMAASVLQGIAGGARLLLIDEDSAASNFLLIDPVMRALLGRTLHGVHTLLEVLPLLAQHGISSVLVAGSSGHSLAVADDIVQMDQWQPQALTRRVRQLIPRRELSTKKITSRWKHHLAGRRLADTPDAIFGPRHFAHLDLREPERPRIKLPLPRAPGKRGSGDQAQQGSASWHTVDLRRCGWPLDQAVVAGALLAAGWVCRLAAGGATLDQLQFAYEQLVNDGAQRLDPFHGRLVAVPPWQLVVTVLERLPVPLMTTEAG